MKKLISILLIILIAITSVLLFYKNTKVKEVSFYSFGNIISGATNITCSYSQTLSANYSDNKITHRLPEPETNPMIFSFSVSQDSEISELSYIDSTQTITTVPIVKLIENNEKFVFLDGTGDNYLTIHTIYKESGVGTYTKNVNLLGTPFLNVSMGTCSGY
jgi:hypothetical protein